MNFAELAPGLAAHAEVALGNASAKKCTLDQAPAHTLSTFDKGIYLAEHNTYGIGQNTS